MFTDSVNRFGDTPDWPERYKHERELFGFLVIGLSASECACYGLFAVGSWLNADQFNFTTDAEKRVVTPERTLERFRIAFPNKILPMPYSKLQVTSNPAIGRRLGTS